MTGGPPHPSGRPEDRSFAAGGALIPSGMVANLASAGLPLEAGLRALSEEAPSRRLRQLLRAMSRELAQGQAPDDVLSRSGSGMPKYLRGLVKAGVQSG
ncbi:MAG: type II secretion system F family protein, partial [Planctomycetaceae bacterium]